MSLNGEGKISVPMMYWKIAYYPESNQGIVFLGFNSPHLNENDIKRNILCNDICDQINWLRMKPELRKNIQKGYVYCCEVKEFLKSYNILSSADLKVNGILQ